MQKLTGRGQVTNYQPMFQSRKISLAQTSFFTPCQFVQAVAHILSVLSTKTPNAALLYTDTNFHDFAGKLFSVPK
jgi:hypothetical protein